jgi:hypothetical protein
MAAKKAARATATVGWIKQGPMPTFLEMRRLPKTDGKRDLHLKVSKNDNPTYRKPFARIVTAA